MKLVQFALSACLVVGSMAGLSGSAFAQAGYGGGHGGGHHSSGHRGRGHQGGGNHGGGHGRGYGRGGAFVAGAVIGALVGGWNGGYGYPRAQRSRYGRYHRPYYAPQPRHGGGHHRQYSGHTRGYYSYSGGGTSSYQPQTYQSRGGSSGCHPVNKIDYWNGRRANIGGTMCYNSYGTGYVVSGSRYLISYY